MTTDHWYFAGLLLIAVGVGLAVGYAWLERRRSR